MKSHAGFLRDIIENPHDDAPRLIYSDWLEDEGEGDRAEFIRLQCAIDSGDPFAPGRRALLRREWELLRAHGKRWIRADGLADAIDVEYLVQYLPNTHFRRGFVERVWYFSPEQFAAKAPSLFTRAPITGISLWSPYTIPPDRQEWFRNTGYVVSLRAIGLPQSSSPDIPHGNEFPDPEEFRQLVASPQFGRLSSFSMTAVYSDRRHLEILANSPVAPNLRELDLSLTICIGGESWSPLFQSPGLAALRSLRLADAHLRVEGLRALTESAHLGNLRRLSIEADPNRTAMGPQGVAMICSSKCLPSLSELNLHGQSGGAEGLRTLANWPGLSRIARLDISHFYSERDGEGEMREAWTDFVHSPFWGELRELNLEGGNLEELEAILDGRNLATVRVLTFAYEFCREMDTGTHSLQDEAAALLARCKHLTEDVEIQIAEKGLTEKGRRLLRERFGDNLILYSGEGAHRQPGDWSSGRASRSTFGE